MLQPRHPSFTLPNRRRSFANKRRYAWPECDMKGWLQVQQGRGAAERFVEARGVHDGSFHAFASGKIGWAHGCARSSEQEVREACVALRAHLV